MKTLTKTINAYYFDELPKETQQKVIEDYKNDSDNQQFESDLFYEDIMERLKEKFPTSDLKVEFSLCYRQGDGLNVYGELFLPDFINNVWETTEKEKRTMLFYTEYVDYFTFTSDNRYSFSNKSTDELALQWNIEDMIRAAKFNGIKNINEKLIEKFYNDMINYFEKLDSEYEKEGYSTIYFDYDGADENIASTIIGNEWMYDIDGNFIADFEYECECEE